MGNIMVAGILHELFQFHSMSGAVILQMYSYLISSFVDSKLAFEISLSLRFESKLLINIHDSI